MFEQFETDLKRKHNQNRHPQYFNNFSEKSVLFTVKHPLTYPVGIMWYF